MNFQTRIQMQVLVGLGAALLMAGTVRAQQDMDPTCFDVNPGTAAASKVVTVKNIQGAGPAVRGNEQSQNTVALASSNEGTLEAGVARIAVVDAGIGVILFAGIVSIGLYAMAATRRERSSRVASGRTPYAPVSAATAQ